MRGKLFILLPVFAAALTLSCSRTLGWGVLLWSTEDPPIPSGTILPVYVRSNINQSWIAGIPKEYRMPGSRVDKFELPLWQLELAGRRGTAKKRAAAYAEFASTYAETLQDGLPIREDPDNTARRVYRLRLGQIIKILSRAQGNPAISTTGDPLPGEWYQVLTEDGSMGYCFSYRLKLFNQNAEFQSPAPAAEERREDPELEMILSQSWSPDWYETMISSGKINLEDLSKRWRFSLGQDSGTAQIYLPGLNRTFSYTSIQSQGNRTWRFDGTSLEMTLRSDNFLELQYDGGGGRRSLIFVSLPSDVDDLIIQETERRNALFRNLYDQGPVFSSISYGNLTFLEGGQFTWTDYYLIDSAIIPSSVLGSGDISMGLFLDSSLEGRYTGAFTFRFNGVGGPGTAVNFLYTLDDQGLRVEYVPPENIEGLTVFRRAPSPLIIAFFKADAGPAALF